jgi:hypothetical protein
MGPRTGLYIVETIKSCHAGNRTPAVEPVPNRYSDWATPTVTVSIHWWNVTKIVKISFQEYQSSFRSSSGGGTGMWRSTTFKARILAFTVPRSMMDKLSNIEHERKSFNRSGETAFQTQVFPIPGWWKRVNSWKSRHRFYFHDYIRSHAYQRT